jgi:hypothetical protein
VRFLVDSNTGDVMKYGLHSSGHFDDKQDSYSHLLFPETITYVVVRDL